MSETTLRQRMIDRYSPLFWTKIVPLTRHLPPKLLARFSKGLDAEAFAKLVAQASDEQIAEAMQGPLRTVMLDEIVNRMEEEFVPDRAAEVDAVFQFNILGSPTGQPDVYQIKVKDKQCQAAKGKKFEPTVSVEVDAADFIKMTAGQVKGMQLYLGGKLKMDGAMMLLTRLENMFNIPDPGKSTPAKPSGAMAGA